MHSTPIRLRSSIGLLSLALLAGCQRGAPDAEATGETVGDSTPDALDTSGPSSTGADPPSTSTGTASSEDTGTFSTSTGETDSSGSESSDSTGDDPKDPVEASYHSAAASAAELMVGDPVAAEASSTPERIAAFADTTWTLAFDVLKVIDAAVHPDFAASPTSMAIAGALAYDRHQTTTCAASLHSQLHFPESGTALHETLGTARLELESRGLLEGPDGEGEVQVRFANTQWEFSAGQLDPPGPVQRLYGARRHSVNRSPAARELINCVIEAQSDGLIADFLPDSIPAMDTAALDVNVAFLAAPWAHELVDDDQIEFTADDGSRKTVSAHSGSGPYVGYAEQDGWRAIDVPLRGGELSVMFVMAAPGETTTLAELASNIDVGALRRAVDSSEGIDARLTLPEVDIGSETIDYMKPLEIVCGLFTVRKFLHGAAFAMNGKGVRAAAGTGVETWDDSGEPDWQPVAVDRAFLFFIHDRVSGLVVYSGRFAG